MSTSNSSIDSSHPAGNPPFLAMVNALLEMYHPLSQADATAAVEAITDAARTAKFAHLIDRGPCLECGIEIAYAQGKQHRIRGNRWLDILYAAWRRPAVITGDDRGTIRYDGYAQETIQLYVCDPCLAELFHQGTSMQEAKTRQAREKQSAFIIGVLNGTITTTPYKEFSIIAANTCDDDIAALKAMPYKKFLQTRYWQGIRRYVVYRKRVCELCASSEHLNVHHKTYERHGHEHETDVALKDLTVLCRPCHARFHNKLANPA